VLREIEGIVERDAPNLKFDNHARKGGPVSARIGWRSVGEQSILREVFAVFRLSALVADFCKACIPISYLQVAAAKSHLVLNRPIIWFCHFFALINFIK
jgi:hypothetical protein